MMEFSFTGDKKQLLYVNDFRIFMNIILIPNYSQLYRE